MTFAQHVTFVNNPIVHPNATQQIILARKKERSEYLSLCLLSCQVLCSSTKVHGSLTCSLGILSLWVLGISTFLWPLASSGWGKGSKPLPSPYLLDFLNQAHSCVCSVFNKLFSIRTKKKKKKPNLKNVSA